ncbi:MAG: Elongation factor 4 [Candidatus Pacebacteria bacterium GW2011_GWA1_46_10]|nr:MAG: Elongation factor 4 [Candidatus Pacebacteria bacterium GW2011_GWA1_46_10]
MPFMQPQAKIRNFSIIAHIDHGKTTLTDAFLRATGTISPTESRERIMDSNPIEQEKGVTIKLAPVKMEYEHEGEKYTLNLIDTPGHVDFGYEVNRSLAACEGALLLIDATQGVQAQTLANFEKAKTLGLKIIPIINKIDLPGADIEQVMLEMMEILGVQENEILKVSAKTGQGVAAILQAIVARIPAPTGQVDQPLRAMIVTSIFDNHQGAIAYIRVFDGELKKQPLYLLSTNTPIHPIEIGVFTPERKRREVITTGEVGYVATGLKEIDPLRVGDTITLETTKNDARPLPGYKEPTPMVFMELYPVDANDFSDLKDAMAKLTLHDSALQSKPTHSAALGNGLRVGFLGIFHAEIVRERLTREFDLDLIATAPSVSYQIVNKQSKTFTVNSPAEFPDPSSIELIKEPMTKAMIFTPANYIPTIYKLTREKRGTLLNTTHTGTRVRLEYALPLAELITDFHDLLKSASSGFASLEYEITGYKNVDAVKVNILINHEVVEALSFIAVTDKAEEKGRSLVKKLKEIIPRQMFEVPIQAAIGGKIIARETLKAYRKDVTAKLYGGDVTRRMKLLRKQSKGKKKMKSIGKVELNQEAFLAVLKN